MKATATAIIAGVFALTALSAVYADEADTAKTETPKADTAKNHQDKRQELQNIIKKYDKNNNGKLDGDEIDAAKKDGVDEKVIDFASKDPSERKAAHKKCQGHKDSGK